MPDINEPTEAEIEAAKADQLWWQQVEEPLGLRLGGWTFRKHALFFDISTDVVVELPGSVAERVIAARRVSPQSDNEPTEAEIEAAAKQLWIATVKGSLRDIDYRWDAIKSDSSCTKYFQNARDALLAARRVSSALSFADGIDAAAKVANDAIYSPVSDGVNIRDEGDAAYYMAAKIRDAIRALSHNPLASSGGDEGKWLGPYKTAAEALDDCRKAVATEIGADPETWPDHGNAALAIAATVALARIRNRSGAAKGNEAEAVAPSLKDVILDAARHVRARPADRRGPYVIGDEELDGIIERLGPKSDASGALKPVEDQYTFVIPDGYEAVRDAEGRATGEVRPVAPKPDPAIAELVEVIRDEATDADGLHNLLAAADNVEAALTASNDRVAELERERDEARSECRLQQDAANANYDRAEAAEAEVSRLKAGAVTDGWRPIETAPTRDENGVASRLLGFFNDRDGGRVDTIWRMDGAKPYWVSRTIELTRGVRYMRAHQPTYWRPLPAGPALEAALSNQAGASK